MKKYQLPMKKLPNSKTSLAPDENCLFIYQSFGTSEYQDDQNNTASELE
jgi:hypothetical protein